MSFTAPTVLDNLKTLIEARENIADDAEVGVYTGPISPGTPHPRKAVVLGLRIEEDDVPRTVGPTIVHQEDYDIECTVVGTSPLAGETGIKAARDAAAGTLEEVRAALEADPTVSGVCVYAYISRIVWNQGLDEDRGRVCTAEFQVTVRARI